MKKVIWSIMVVAFSMVSFSASAQEKQCDKSQCVKEKCDKAQKCGKQMQAPCPFDGLNLTPEQKEKIKALKANCKENKCDRKKQRAHRDSMAQAAKAKHLAEIKAILTPEQYVQYLENMVVKQGPKQGRMSRQNHKCGKMKQHCSQQGQCPKGDK